MVSRTNSFACEVNCSKIEPCDPWRCTPPVDGAGLSVLDELMLEFRAKTFPTLGCLCRVGIAGT